MTTIHATGSSQTHHLAERATVSARVSIAAPGREESIEGATRLHNLLVARAKQLRENDDATWHSADPISTWARKNYHDGTEANPATEYVTSSRVQVKLSNLDLVSAFVAELALLGAETDVAWSLTETSRRAHERAVRKAAVLAARDVAEDYAEALGERVARVVSVSDSSTVSMPMPGVRMMAAMDAAPSAEVTVAEIAVSATVQGEFESE